MTIAIVIASILLLTVVTLAILYHSGKSRLYAKAGRALPEAMVSSDTDLEIAKDKAQLATVAWQDNWIAYDGKIYEYNEDTINLLFLGIDQHGFLQKETDYSNWESGQADAIFVLSLNPTDKTMKIVAIPRNSMVELNIYDANGMIANQIRNQICLQYGYAGGGKNGMEEMKRAVSEVLYDLPIHGVTVIAYDAISMLNDMIGGVDVVVLEDITQYDPIMVQGENVHLMGEHAYLYVQYRDVTKVGSPTARLQRQKQYLSAFVEQAKIRAKQNILIVTDMYRGLEDYMKTDITLDEAVYLATEVLDYSFDLNSIFLLAGKDCTTSFISEDGTEDFYDDYELDEENLKKTVIDVFYNEVRF